MALRSLLMVTGCDMVTALSMVVYLENLTQSLKKRQYFKFPYMGFYDQNEGFHVVLKGEMSVLPRTHVMTEKRIQPELCKELTPSHWV